MDRNIRVLGLGMAARSFGAALYFPFLALFLRASLGLGYLEIGVLFFAVGLLQLPFNLLGGLATDRVGRRNLMIIGLLGEAVATLALAYSFALRSLPGAIVAATAGGMITTVAGPAFSAYIADFASETDRARGFTWARVGFNAGFSAGVTMGGVLVVAIGFPWAVGIGAAVIFGVAGVMAGLLASSPFDLVNAAGDAQGLPRAPTQGGRSFSESLRILRKDRPSLEVALAFAFASLAVAQWSVIFPLFVQNDLGVPYYLLGVGLALNGLVVVFGQTWTTESVVGRRHTRVAEVGLVLYVVAFVGLGVAGKLGLFPVVAFFVAVFILTIGENLLSIPQSTLPSNLAPEGEVGSYNGAFGAITSAGFLFSILIGTAVLSLTTDPLVIWGILMAPAVPALVLLRHSAALIPPRADRI
ncbi:MAG: MFS transporter [Thermoplasmata archaeon]|nr:MFS transporter [Thermoplasmata archaeon]